LSEDKFAAYQLLELNPFIWSLTVSGLLGWLVSLGQAHSSQKAEV
jgi:hypothetical protein